MAYPVPDIVAEERERPQELVNRSAWPGIVRTVPPGPRSLLVRAALILLIPLAACSTPEPGSESSTTGTAADGAPPETSTTGTDAQGQASSGEGSSPEPAPSPTATGTSPTSSEPPSGSDPADTAPPPPTSTSTPASSCLGSEELIASAEWVQRDGRPALRVTPSEELRRCGLVGPADPAWAQLLEVAPDADTPGMAEQFECHVRFAPTQETWHLEPWRPAVEFPEMIRTRCNPTG